MPMLFWYPMILMAALCSLADDPAKPQPSRPRRERDVFALSVH
ncbi:MAG TPA: hypothetical protein VFB45_24220 [Pseudolabrys sp.]|nr:hypothetical protein [Pseudolabrys sp.]